MSNSIPSIIEQLTLRLTRRYGVEASSVRAVFSPYRICPLGAHIDHQLGPVTAMAIDQGVVFAYAKLPQRELRLSSLNYPDEVHIDLDTFSKNKAGNWGDYMRGAAYALKQSGHQLHHGLAGIVSGTQRSDGGLSSSAAVGIAYLLALEDINELDVTPWGNIRLDQAIENDYLGVHNGILDPAAVLLSRKNQLTLINCATATHELIAPPVSMPPSAIIVASSGMKKSLVNTGYNLRVSECSEAARILLKAAGRENEQPLLSNVRIGEYAEHRDQLPPSLALRAAHFFSEVDRVHRGVEAWKRGDLTTFGSLIPASGESSIRNYECGAQPLIDLYQILCQCEGVYGARMSGAGFRGCCIGLLAPESSAQVRDRVREAYRRCQPELAVDTYVEICHSSDGPQLSGQPHELKYPS